ncbi:MAG TPA: phosphoribosylformylglycinamidine synthase subunit PurS, partial [Ktedonobacteraceae bacterium]|nr:phosphoribosylformylglycinamidine synthase subunit PurS [Ktedonobacteraceae bacterium]
MVILQIEVRAKVAWHDVRAHRLAREILQLPLPGMQEIQGWPSLPPPTPLSSISTDPSLTSSLPSTSPIPISIRTAQLYRITAAETFTHAHLDRLITELLIDPVVQEAHVHPVEADLSRPSPIDRPLLHGVHSSEKLEHTQNTQHTIVDVFFHPGVTDTLAESVLAGAQLLGIPGLERVETGQRFLLDARLSEADARAITEALLYNPVIQDYTLYPVSTGDDVAVPPHLAGAINRAPTEAVTVTSTRTTAFPLSTMSDTQLIELSKNGMLALNLDEMRAIQAYFRDERREPTDVEMETLAQTWSEHCSHKTFRAEIDYREIDSEGHLLAHERIPGLLKHYLMRATEQVQRPWVVSAFRDNAGIIRFTERQDIAFKVETHNHPSAIEPFGGANTGVGGVIRDVLGVSAQPIACTDVLCFGQPDTPAENLPAGVLSPRRIASGVVNGVRDYGNKMGIPTVNGAILYNDGYICNPLVFCGCLGMLPHDSHPQNAQAGDLIVVLGGRTGRDGIHGATFSSGEMSSEVLASAGSAVQIGAPITEKKVTDVILAARDRQLYSAITDCGAGGFSSAIGEMGAETGAQVELSHAPLKYAGLAPWEIWLSEAQERMVLAVPPVNQQELLALCTIEEVEASVLGTFTNDHRLVVTYNGQTVANLDMDFLHHGRPNRTLKAVWEQGRSAIPVSPPGRPLRSPLLYTNEASGEAVYSRGDPCGRPGAEECNDALLTLLCHPTIASKEDVVRRYDHEVQGATVLKPLVGLAGNGPGDAAVLQPILDEPTGAGIVLSNGVNPLYGRIDPYHMALNAVDEALRNLTAVGGDIERAAILDNFCWGNPNDPVQLGMLVRAVQGCYDAAVGFGTPFISGKDSLNNEYRSGDKRLPVIPTLLISAVGVIPDAAQTIDMSLKAPGNLLYLVGTTRNELAGSHYAEIQPLSGDIMQHTRVPQVDIA